MAISVPYKDSITVFSNSATSIGVTVDNGVQAGDLIVIPYFARETTSMPSGFTKHGEIIAGNIADGRVGFAVKEATGSEGGTTVSITQSSSGRIEAFHFLLRGDNPLSVSKTDTVDGGTTFDAPLPTQTLSEASAFMALGIAGNEYSEDNTITFDIHEDSDAGFARLNTTPESDAGVSGNRLWGAYAYYASGATSTLRWMPNVGSVDAMASMLTVVETAPASPPQGTVTISSVNPGETDAVVTYSYDDTDESGFEYRIDGGTPATLDASPATITGLTESTTYDIEVRAVNGAGDGAWSSVTEFTTDAAAVAVKGARVTLYDGATEQASVTGITAMWWDSSPPTGNPVFTTSSASTDASGVLEVDLDADTALDIGNNGHLTAYKLDATDEKDSLGWQGRLQVEDIS